jgi:hypothetical protein
MQIEVPADPDALADLADASVVCPTLSAACASTPARPCRPEEINHDRRRT